MLERACLLVARSDPRAAGKLGPVAIAPLLTLLADYSAEFHEYHDASKAAQDALALMGQAAVPALVEALAEPRFVKGTEVIEVLARIGDPRALDAILLRLEQSDDAIEDRTLIRGMVADSLARFRHPRTTAALLRALERERGLPGSRPGHDLTLYHIVDALGALGDPGAIGGLERAQRDDPEDGVRDRAARAIAACRRGSPVAVAGDPPSRSHGTAARPDPLTDLPKAGLRDMDASIDHVIRVHHKDRAAARLGMHNLIKGSTTIGVPGPAVVGLLSHGDDTRDKLARVGTDAVFKVEWWDPLPAVVRGNVGLEHHIGLFCRASDSAAWMKIVAADLPGIAPLEEKSDFSLADWRKYGFDVLYPLTEGRALGVARLTEPL